MDAVLTLKELRELRFGCTSIGVGIEGAKFAEVSAMGVSALGGKDEGAAKLERLKLQGCNRVNDESIPVLAALPGLREVDLKGTALRRKVWPHCARRNPGFGCIPVLGSPRQRTSEIISAGDFVFNAETQRAQRKRREHKKQDRPDPR